MLVLNRKIDQEIILSGNIRVTILAVKGSSVRIGIDAPGEVSILRGELSTETGRQSSAQSATTTPQLLTAIVETPAMSNAPKGA